MLAYGEWRYAKIKLLIIVKELLSDGEILVPIDYKFWALIIFRGNLFRRSRAIDVGRFNGDKYCYGWRLELLVRVDFGFPNRYDGDLPKPAMFDEMSAVADALAKPFPTSRIDFYVLGDRFYIGEITFFNGAGFDKISPPEFNNLIGSD